MKKRNLMIVGLVLSLSMLAAGSAFARWDGDYGAKGQRGYNCWASEDGSDVDLEGVIKFKKETLGLRDQLLTKRLELKQEYNKENPNADTVGKMRKEIVDIQTSIAKVAASYDLGDFGKGKRARSGSARGYGNFGGGCF